MARNAVIDGKTIVGPLDYAITERFVLIEAFLPIGGSAEHRK
jgi:hypothetical protein